MAGLWSDFPGIEGGRLYVQEGQILELCNLCVLGSFIRFGNWKLISGCLGRHSPAVGWATQAGSWIRSSDIICNSLAAIQSYQITYTTFIYCNDCFLLLRSPNWISHSATYTIQQESLSVEGLLPARLPMQWKKGTNEQAMREGLPTCEQIDIHYWKQNLPANHVHGR